MQVMAKRTPKPLADDTTTPADQTEQKPVRTRSRRPKAASGRRSVEGAADTGITIVADDVIDTRDYTPGFGPTKEDIRLRAYHRFLERGALHGLDIDDWLQAEE